MLKNQKIRLVLLIAIILLCGMIPIIFISSVTRTEVIYPTYSTFAQTINCGGQIMPTISSRVSMKTPLLVKTVYVQNGSYVKAGQKLFDVDIEKLASISANGLDDSAEVFENSSYEQMISAFSSGSVGFDNFKSLPTAVYATDDGTVGNFSVSEGAMVSAGSTICTISEAGSCIVKITVPEDQLGKFSVGNTVRFSPIAYPDKEYYGTVNDSDAVVRRQLTTTGYKSVADLCVSVEASDEYITDGMSVSVVVDLPVKENILTIPYQSVAQDDVGEYIYTVKNGETIKKYITTGLELDNGIEVLSGIDNETAIIKDISKITSEGELVWLG